MLAEGVADMGGHQHVGTLGAGRGSQDGIDFTELREVLLEPLHQFHIHLVGGIFVPVGGEVVDVVGDHGRRTFGGNDFKRQVKGGEGIVLVACEVDAHGILSGALIKWTVIDREVARQGVHLGFSVHFCHHIEKVAVVVDQLFSCALGEEREGDSEKKG